MTVPDATPEAAELGDVLLAPCNACGHWPGDHHVDTGCRACRCDRDMLAVEVDSVLASSWLAQRDARIRAEALRDAANDANRIHCGYPTNPQIRSINAIRRWLYERADRIEALP